MLLVICLVFLTVFGVSALVLVAGRNPASRQAEQTIATLEAAIASSTFISTAPVIDIRKREMMSAVPTLNQWLMRLEFAPKLRTLLSQADLQWTTGTLLLLSAVCFVVPSYVAYYRTEALFLSILLGLATGSIPLFYVLFKRRRRFSKFEEEFPHTLDLMVGALRAGHSLFSALDVAAAESPEPIRSELRLCFDEQNYGLDIKTAMMNLLTRVPLQDLRIVVTAMLIQRESGGNLAEIFDKASYIIRERFRLKRQVRVHTAQGRMTGWILSLLPVILGFALYFVNPTYMSILWTTPVGIKLLWGGAVGTIAGSLIIRKIVGMDV
jgi:tight adherence protein B